MNIYEIAEKTKKTCPYFFTKDTMKFFGQTMAKFKLKKMPDGRTRISQPMKDHTGKIMGQTIRYFNPETNDLDFE
jgi:hypothetical protein